jgi:isoleucyl-tRNA synthetase
MLSNLDDLGVADIVAREQLEPLDRLACSVTDAFVRDVKGLYDRFLIHDAYLRIVEFESSMSGLYFDALKDPLYARAENDARRRSAQSALLYALKRLLTVVAPILSFTAEEAWQEIPERLRGDEASVFDASFDTDSLSIRPQDLELWELLRELRSRVAAGFEQDGATIRDYETAARVVAPAEMTASLEALGDNLREALIVSQIDGIEPGALPDVRLRRADGKKCARCWKFRELGTSHDHPSICADCAAVVS